MAHKTKKIKLKVFHGLVNYGTQSGLFAKELRRQGFDAISVTKPDAFKRITDVELKHGGTFIEKIAKHSWNWVFRLSCFFRYDIFHFYFGQTLLPKQIDMPFYRIFGKKVLMEYLGSDIQNFEISVKKYKWTNINHRMSLEQGKIHDLKISRRYQKEIRYIDKTLVCAPIYSEFAFDSECLPLAIDISSFNFTPLPEKKSEVIIMHAPTHRGYKGTSYIENAILKLKSEGYAICFDLVENVTHAELLNRYKKCHIFIDQIMAGWYGTATIEAMAIGRPVIVSIRPDYLDYIDFGSEIPVISADPDNIYVILKQTIDSGYGYWEEKGNASRKFVEKNHDVKAVTRRLIEIYNKL